WATFAGGKEDTAVGGDHRVVFSPHELGPAIFPLEHGFPHRLDRPLACIDELQLRGCDLKRVPPLYGRIVAGRRHDHRTEEGARDPARLCDVEVRPVAGPDAYITGADRPGLFAYRDLTVRGVLDRSALIIPCERV